MDIKHYTKPPEHYVGDMLVYFVQQPEKGVPKCPDSRIKLMMQGAVKAGDFLGKEGQALLLYPELRGSRKKIVKRILLVGLGKDEPSREMFRKAGGTVAQRGQSTKSQKILVKAPDIKSKKLTSSDICECLTEGLILGSYQFRKYKTKEDPDEETGTIKEISLAGKDVSGLRRSMTRGRRSSEAVCAARDMANEPGNFWTPSHFAVFSRSLAKKYNLRARVLGKAEMKRLHMGGILGVAQGSAQSPTVNIVEYRTGKKVPTLLLVGKGLTFDSGGISIKPSGGMHDMKMDMCGGAAVLAAMQVIGQEKPKNLDVVAIVPASENLPGPSALKPGDIITQYGGKTVEVINTDAEGRIIVADALAYGVKKFMPDAVIDVATLTGAIIVALGHHRTGLLSNDDTLAEKVTAAAEKSGEPVWRLPLGKEYRKQLKSTVADLKNIGNRTGGSITAGAFLQEFVGEVPWVHLDIAGTAWNFTEKPYIPKGPSGTGVRTILELVRDWRNK